ncbi:FAST kinase domain-containing protein 1 [Operophtera brumata]|uniref:FAST kinase domain-containing protein 1 n=1 Tax=Operophtera brumata TaxID=104452 RepID=A0A0L7L8B3_OPEBR|nr:FAST kinase domain-containing protein 1 [Operophtera brumata]
MSCASPRLVSRLTLLILTFIVTCTFIASVVWLLRTRATSGQYENYYLSRINITAVKTDVNGTEPVSDHYKDLIKIEIAMRRVEENSRRLKEYTKSLLWDNKDKSLWCVLFKDGERSDKPERGGKNKNAVDEEYIRSLREQKMREALIHLRHHGTHHRRRPDVLPNMPFIK